VTVCRFTLLVGRAARAGTVAALAAVVNASGVAFAADDGGAAGALCVDQASPSMSAAAQIVRQLHGSIPTVQLITEYNSTTDPDGLLGLPGQYTAKVQFADGNTLTGYVEVFDTASDRASRVDALLPLSQSGSEKDVSSGKLLLRLIPSATASPAAINVDSYQSALAAVTPP